MYKALQLYIKRCRHLCAYLCKLKKDILTVECFEVFFGEHQEFIAVWSRSRWWCASNLASFPLLIIPTVSCIVSFPMSTLCHAGREMIGALMYNSIVPIDFCSKPCYSSSYLSHLRETIHHNGLVMHADVHEPHYHGWVLIQGHVPPCSDPGNTYFYTLKYLHPTHTI